MTSISARGDQSQQNHRENPVIVSTMTVELYVNPNTFDFRSPGTVGWYWRQNSNADINGSLLSILSKQ